MALAWKDYELSPEAVEEISADLQSYISSLGAKRREILRIRLTVEEILIRIMEGKEDTPQIKVGMGKQYGRYALDIRYGGEPFDPTESEGDEWSGKILSALGLSPAWSYRRKANRVTLTLKERGKKSTLFYLITAIAAAVVLGFLGRFIPETVTAALDVQLITPLMTAFLGLLNTFAGFMIAFTVCSGVMGVGDSSALGRMGKGVILRFLSLSALASVFAMLFSLPFVALKISVSLDSALSQIDKITGMIFGILPTDPISPFSQGNTMQIIVISVCVGAGLLSLGERTAHIRTFIEEGTLILQRITEAVCSLIPVFVFAALLHQFWAGDALLILSVWKPICLCVGLSLVWSAAMYIFAAVRLGCSPVLLLKKTMPPFFVAFSTASSMSVFTMCMDICRKKLGVGDALVKFAYPIGMVVYKPAFVVELCVFSCVFAQTYSLDVSVPWLVLAALTALFLAVAVPPIPGAALIVYSVLFAQLGIPAEALLLAATIEILMDHVNTAFHVGFQLVEIARMAKVMGNIDRDALLRRE
ncbi:MAG: cation:dicarboxylase symporter family transporter [Clostridia bacterium]|nr:cation:dicarboxylase symporter family transporter [Clostridia bacterium]